MNDVLYQLGNLRILQSDTQTGILYNRSERRSISIPASTARALLACEGFKTLDDHARAIAVKYNLSAEATSQTRAVLEKLSEAGVLNSAEDAFRADTAAPRALPLTNTISTVGVVTADRGASLETTLRSIGIGLSSNRAVTVIIGDGSKSSEGRSKTLSVAQAFTKSTGRPVRYFDLARKNAYCDILTERGLPSKVLQFGLLGLADHGISTGANRNCLLLDTRLERTLQCDDDIRWQAVRHPGGDAKVQLGSHADPYDYWFFQTRSEAVASNTVQEIDILAEIGSKLGLTLSSLIGSTDRSQLVVDGACTHFVGRSLEDSARVVLSTAGLVGDCGMSSSAGFLQMQGESRERMVADQETYLFAMKSRNIVMMVPRNTITHGSGCMAYCLGIDNHGFIAPFLPNGRNQDGVFAALLAACRPMACTWHSPIGLIHEPPDRTYVFDHLQWAATTRLSDLVIALIDAWQCPSVIEDVNARCTGLGQYLRTLGESSEMKFESWAEEACVVSKYVKMKEVGAVLDEFRSQPSRWASDSLAYRDALKASIVTSDSWVPAELRTGRTLKESKAQTRSYIWHLGRLLELWPQILSACSDLCRDGIHISLPV